MSLDDLCRDYSFSGLTEKDLARDPIHQFERWFQEAEAAKILVPNAMVCSLATCSGAPSSRTVLLKGFDARGFVFYSNYESRKGRELAENPRASLLFPWLALERQVIIEGSVLRVTREESEVYFHSRPPMSQLGAWASAQSTVIVGREVIEEAIQTLDKKYAGQTVPMPSYWGGYRVQPETIEFWQGRRSRLHDRLRYRREQDGTWIIERLSP